MPIAFEPPPTHATTTSGSRPSASRNCSRASWPITACRSRTISGIRMRADARADQVVRRLDVRDPVANRLARRLLERPRAEVDRANLGAEQVHPLDVRPLAPHVLLAHVDDALEAEARAHRRRCDPVLSRTGLRDDAVLAEPPREHRLAERVVELVRAGVQQILALQVEALARRKPLGARERCRPAREGAAELLELRVERLVRLRVAPACLELVERRDQRLRDVTPAVRSVEARRHSPRRLDERAHLVVILDRPASPRASTPRRRPTGGRPDRLADVVGPEPPASITRPVGHCRALEVQRVLLVPGEIDDVRDGLAFA